MSLRCQFEFSVHICMHMALALHVTACERLAHRCLALSGGDVGLGDGAGPF